MCRCFAQLRRQWQAPQQHCTVQTCRENWRKKTRGKDWRPATAAAASVCPGPRRDILGQWSTEGGGISPDTPFLPFSLNKCSPRRLPPEWCRQQHQQQHPEQLSVSAHHHHDPAPAAPASSPCLSEPSCSRSNNRRHNDSYARPLPSPSCRRHYPNTPDTHPKSSIKN